MVSSNTPTGYLRKYQEYGIEGLKELNFYQPQSELSQHTTTIEAYLFHKPITRSDDGSDDFVQFRYQFLTVFLLQCGR